MFKLILLTVLAFGAVLMFLGGDDGARTAAPQPAAATADTAPVEPEPADPAPTSTDPAAASAPVITDVAQTPERRRDFPGPELRPSPEYAQDAPAEDLAEAPSDRLFVTGSTVNFRAGPSTADTVVGSLSRGEMVTAIGPRSGDWIEIRDERGRTGFMSAAFLSAERP
ncbi:SH3 domain-containing protein [Paracoccus xiamenensis]|uniref:SH3 domain-containing protein n=1 Tax=Paracoccus xiamenensis TaxID=2714901 RepID=UPI00140E2669|nr:SH3 domain-containing protein [Paracoccus xiamenensis]NHF74219.1 SH3 domain-containing protein [Paracoccus xiamenensis]